ncbi:hypothetical protein [Xanthomonas dyei]|uniref:hypothetical protein n=1 Tax=Xanthomonas dyei TaxID=743699 RepID=UPI002260D8C4|nr:hypothetical protein [Xanthomonas dyei]
MVPLDFNDPARNIQQGVERNAWGRPVAYHVYNSTPAIIWPGPAKPSALAPSASPASSDCTKCVGLACSPVRCRALKL